MLRKQDVERLSLNRAIEYFSSNGVGLHGVKTQAQLNEALNDHRHGFSIKPRLSDEIERYLLTHDYTRGDIKVAHRDVVASHRLRSGRAKVSRLMIFRLKMQNWWQKRQ